MLKVEFAAAYSAFINSSLFLTLLLNVQGKAVVDFCNGYMEAGKRKLTFFFVREVQKAVLEVRLMMLLAYTSSTEIFFFKYKNMTAEIKLGTKILHILSHRMSCMYNWDENQTFKA